MNTIKNTGSNVNIRGHLRSCSLNGNEPGDAIETTWHSFYDNEKFWTSACDQLKSITGQRITLKKHFTSMDCTLEPRYSHVTQVSGYSILGEPGAVSRAGRKGATKVFKHRRKSPWVPTLTGPFPNGQADAGFCLEQLLLLSFREFVHDGYYLATVAWFVHQAFPTRNEGTTDESKNVSNAISRSNQFVLRKFCFWRITMYRK